MGFFDIFWRKKKEDQDAAAYAAPVTGAGDDSPSDDSPADGAPDAGSGFFDAATSTGDGGGGGDGGS